MTEMPQFDSVDSVQAWALASLLGRGRSVSPRGASTLELHPVSFALLNPRKRCVTNLARRWSLPLAIGEFCWHVSASDDAAFIEYYSSSWRNFADGSRIRGSCYGRRIFGTTDGKCSQWQQLVRLLTTDPQSRRAVLNVMGAEGTLSAEAVDIPCTCTIQFLLRSGHLDAVIYMRSNDAIWGLPYDIFLFSMLQEMLAVELGVQLGSYFHTVASLHLYERHLRLAQEVVSNPSLNKFEMPVMPELQNLPVFLSIEKALRTGGEVTEADTAGIPEYWRELIGVLVEYARVRADQTYNIPVPRRYEPFLRMMQTKKTAAHV
jgi:thymidylate synthase